jgi:hypothetical protein
LKPRQIEIASAAGKPVQQDNQAQQIGRAKAA